MPTVNETRRMEQTLSQLVSQFSANVNQNKQQLHRRPCVDQILYRSGLFTAHELNWTEPQHVHSALVDLGFLEGGYFGNPSEHWRGLGLRESEIWTFVS